MKKLLLFLLVLNLESCQIKKETTNTLSYETNIFEYGELYEIDLLFNNPQMFFEDKYLDVSKLGDNIMKINYTINDKKYVEKYKYTVVDTTSPLIYIKNNYTMYIGEEDDLVNRVICADNQDAKPNCFIEGYYDLNTEGKYALKYVAIDNQGNQEQAEFTLTVKKEKEENNKSSEKTSTLLEDIINQYKTNDTMIGIDVSKYQGDIDWQKVKESGVEFAMIRVGIGYNDINKIDEKFIQNIEGALNNNIEVGIYFYSYATTEEEVILEANYVLENIKKYHVTFPIAFDWENFEGWNNYGLSLYDLRHLNELFLDIIKENGYKAVQYGSKNFMRYFWEPIKNDRWLAFYVKENQTQDYEKPIKMWQICNNGIVPGISTDVDIDIYYK